MLVFVGDVNEANPERKVTVAARVPPDLADAVRSLADAGDRTLSREVCCAIREHVDKAGPSSIPVVDISGTIHHHPRATMKPKPAKVYSNELQHRT